MKQIQFTKVIERAYRAEAQRVRKLLVSRQKKDTN